MTILNQLHNTKSGSRELDAAIYCHVEECEFVTFVSDFDDDFIKVKRSGFKYVHDEIFPAYTTSIDAALALVERMLPDAQRYDLRMNVRPIHEIMWMDTKGRDVNFKGFGATAPLAILTALFTALEAKNTTP